MRYYMYVCYIHSMGYTVWELLRFLSSGCHSKLLDEYITMVWTVKDKACNNP